MQDVAQRINIAQKHLMQPMQSGNRLRRDRIIVEFPKTNLDRLCVNQSSPKLRFDELQDIVHLYFDAVGLDHENHPRLQANKL